MTVPLLNPTEMILISLVVFPIYGHDSYSLVVGLVETPPLADVVAIFLSILDNIEDLWL